MRPSPLFLGLIAATIAGGALTILDNKFAYTAGVVILVLGGWAVSLCLHEFGHAYTAFRGGDYEVRAKGYLSLDIRRYTDPVFSIVLPVLFLLIGGIPLPGGAVWLNRHAMRNKRVQSWVSLAGPLTNLAIGVLLIVAVRVFFDPSLVETTRIGNTTYVAPDPSTSILAAGLSYLAFLQIFAFVLNILPLPGLDGWGAIEPWLSYQAKAFGAKARPWAPLILFAVLLGIPQVGSAFSDLIDSAFRAIGGQAGYSAFGQLTFKFWN
ncbi:Zn-dependent protease [Actinocrispum wychmicini]|uniref:Zn-dependent protease n=1 Tax=Actinocrispum wychmicini TaxID=1213861 RepID=A0A4R2JYI3_9PSEU|nr:Zn-dependent protease [Actinocrispum wychmicini]